MKLSRAFLRIDPRIAAVALLIAMAGPVLAIDPPKGSLRSREFSAPELAVSSSHVPLDDVLAELPNRAALGALPWRAGGGRRRGRVHVFIDPRSGAATNIMAPFPLLPGDGVGNRVGLAELGARLGRTVARRRRRGRGRGRATVRAGARRAAGHRRRPSSGPLRATQVSDTLWQVSAPQVVNGITVRDARLALTISHGNVVAFGTEGWGTAALRHEAGHGRREGDGTAAFDLCRRPLAARRRCCRSRGSRSWPRRRPGRAPTRPTRARWASGYVHRLVWSMTFQRPPEDAPLGDAGRRRERRGAGLPGQEPLRRTGRSRAASTR